MSSDKIYLTKEEQNFLMDMLEVKTPKDAAEEFALMLVKQGLDPTNLQSYVKRIMREYAKKISQGDK